MRFESNESPIRVDGAFVISCLVELGQSRCRLKNRRGCSGGRLRRCVRLLVRAPGEPVHKVVWRPGSGQLHEAFAHHGAGGRKLVLVALNVLAVNEVRNVEHHFAVFSEAAAYFFVEGHEEAVHLEADGARTGLALAGAGCVLAKIAQILAANALDRQMALDFLGAAIVDENLQMHLGLAAEFVDVAEELALIGTDGFAEDFVVVEDSPESEGKYGGMLKAIRDHPGVINTSLLVEGFGWVVLAYDDGEVACGIEKHLIAAYSKDGFKRYRLAMTG